MKITCQWFTGAHPQFNVSLASKEGVEPFLIVKGCRIVNGSNGEFVSWPATKNQSTGKYWNHVWASDAFAAAVLAEARATMPQQQPTRSRAPVDDGPDSSIPF